MDGDGEPWCVVRYGGDDDGLALLESVYTHADGCCWRYIVETGGEVVDRQCCDTGSW